MIKAQIALYAILADKRIDKLSILSDHPEKFEECNSIVKNNIHFRSQVIELFSKYFDIDYAYVHFISLDPIITDETLTLPVYCLVPYSVSLKQGYFISPSYAYNSPVVRKILNII